MGRVYPRKLKVFILSLIALLLYVTLRRCYGPSKVALAQSKVYKALDDQVVLAKSSQESLEPIWLARQEQVKDVFISSWDAYEKHAWGFDRFHPLSKRGSQMSPKGLGWIIIDSLDTLILMNLTSRVSKAQTWVMDILDFDQNQEVNTFETTIRVLGGLLSSNYLLSQVKDGTSVRQAKGYLEKAIDLADRLLGAYESPYGIPYASVNLQKRKGNPSEVSFIAEAGSVQLEMKHLALLTNQSKYWQKAEKAVQAMDNHCMEDGLLPTYVDVEHGRFLGREISLGSRGDSYYEYLIKQYLQTRGMEPLYLEMWTEALAGIQKHMIMHTHRSNLAFVAELPGGVGGPKSPKMDHLVCFLPGAIALGVTGGYTEAYARKTREWSRQDKQQMNLARELMKTCWGMYAFTETKLAPEITWFLASNSSRASGSSATFDDEANTTWKEDYIVKPRDAHNLQRPEAVESLFVMWRITRDPIYREWGWRIFQAFREHSIIDDGEGFTTLDNVNHIPTALRDNMEGFWLSETLKYLYLLFSPTDVLPLHDIVFNTEAHPLPRQTLHGDFRTGWIRKPRRCGGRCCSNLSSKRPKIAKIKLAF